MNKPTIHATWNINLPQNSNASYYVIEKSPKFLEWLKKIVCDILEYHSVENQVTHYIKTKYDKNDQPIGEKTIIKNINKMTDLHEKYEGEKGRADVFYGKTKVFLTITLSKRIRKNLTNFLLKHSKVFKIKKSLKK
jgi:hypothetical protein